jgi:serine/threonine protein kinase
MRDDAMGADATLSRGITSFDMRSPSASPDPRSPSASFDARSPSASFGRGYRLRGRYELDELIGQGAMGQVWRAKDLLGEEALDRNPFVAVKVLNSDFEARADAFATNRRVAPSSRWSCWMANRLTG